MSFEGDAFQSYNTVIARHMEHKGKRAVVLNDNPYSSSTARHASYVRSAVRGTQTFHYTGGFGTNLDPSPKQLFEYAVSKAAAFEALAKAPRIRQNTRDGHNASSLHWLAEAAKVNEFFVLHRKVDSAAETAERLAEATRKINARQVKERSAREKAAVEKAAADLILWLNGEPVYLGSAHYNLPVQFRIETDELVSTLGARVPLADAERANRFALARRAKGWHENGEQCEVGMYRLNAINPQGVVAGCHRIAWAEVERVRDMIAAHNLTLTA